MVTACCFWALIKFMAAYLLAFVIAHLLARDMLVMSYICPCFVLSKIFSCDFPFSSSVIRFSSVRVLLLSWWIGWEFRFSLNFVLVCCKVLVLSFFKGSCLVFGFVSNLHSFGRNLVTLPKFLWLTPIYGILSCLLIYSWLDLLARRY